MIFWIVSSSLLIAVFVLARRALLGHISLRLQYALWLVVLIRLLVPVFPFQSAFSVGNLLTEKTQTVSAETAEPAQAEAENETAGSQTAESEAYATAAQSAAVSASDSAEISEAESASGSQTAENAETAAIAETSAESVPAESSRSAADIFRLIWYAGTAVLGVCFLGSNLIFYVRLRKTRRPFDRFADKAVWVADGLSSPCLFLRSIYLTPEAAEDETTRGHVLEHEATHARHGDPLWNFLRCAALVLHWYNPLVWLAAALSRADAELACDEGTLNRLGEEARFAYGRTLVSLTVKARSPAALFSCATTMSSGKRSLRRRVRLIAQRPRRLLAALLLAALIPPIAVGCTYASAQETDTAELETPWFVGWLEPDSVETISWDMAEEDLAENAGADTRVVDTYTVNSEAETTPEASSDSVTGDYAVQVGQTIYFCCLDSVYAYDLDTAALETIYAEENNSVNTLVYSGQSLWMLGSSQILRYSPESGELQTVYSETDSADFLPNFLAYYEGSLYFMERYTSGDAESFCRIRCLDTDSGAVSTLLDSLHSASFGWRHCAVVYQGSLYYSIREIGSYRIALGSGAEPELVDEAYWWEKCQMGDDFYYDKYVETADGSQSQTWFSWKTGEIVSDPDEEFFSQFEARFQSYALSVGDLSVEPVHLDAGIFFLCNSDPSGQYDKTTSYGYALVYDTQTQEYPAVIQLDVKLAFTP